MTASSAITLPLLDGGHRHRRLVLLENTQIRTQMKELVLYASQLGGDTGFEIRDQRDTDDGVQLIDRAIGMDSSRVFAHSLPASEPRCPVISSSSVDFCDSRHVSRPLWTAPSLTQATDGEANRGEGP